VHPTKAVHRRKKPALISLNSFLSMLYHLAGSRLADDRALGERATSWINRLSRRIVPTPSICWRPYAQNLGVRGGHGGHGGVRGRALSSQQPAQPSTPFFLVRIADPRETILRIIYQADNRLDSAPRYGCAAFHAAMAALARSW
jgi:hypothetical protein